MNTITLTRTLYVDGYSVSRSDITADRETHAIAHAMVTYGAHTLTTERITPEGETYVTVWQMTTREVTS